MLNATDRANMTGDMSVVPVFVRKTYKPGGEHRTMAFWLRPQFDQLSLIDMGYAIDGEQAIRYINMDHESLLDAQRELTDYMTQYNLRLHFR